MSRKQKDSSFLVHGGILAAASVIVRLIGMIYRIPLNRIIGDVGMGLYGGHARRLEAEAAAWMRRPAAYA